MNELNFVIQDTLCPLTVCLFENQNIQLRAEEQDEKDRVNISMYGPKAAKGIEDPSRKPSVEKQAKPSSSSHNRTRHYIPTLELDVDISKADTRAKLKSREDELMSEPENDTV
jgi:hypothetical protein